MAARVVLVLAGAISWPVLVRAAEFQVPVTVVEPAGVDRKCEPASGGVPFKPGQVKSVDELSLFTKDGRPLAAQFTKLAGYADGSVQWALVDFLTDVPAGGKAEFSVQPGKAVGPAMPLQIAETDEAVTVDTGAAKFTVNKKNFSLLESVEMAGKKLAGPGTLELSDGAGKSFKAGKPDRVSWEYRGPVRATLRVEGPYLDEGGNHYLFYTTRLTFWAGLSVVRVEHSLRNSEPEQGFDAKIKEASLGLALGFNGGSQGSGEHWAACGDGQRGVLVAFRHSGGCFPGGADRFPRLPRLAAPEAIRIEVTGERAAVWAVPPEGSKYGYGDGRFNLMDCAHKDTEVWLDFYGGVRDAQTNGKRDSALRSWLHALPDGAWISETGALSKGHFATVDEEIAVYKKWGWHGWETPPKQKDFPKVKHEPAAYIRRALIHNETEADYAQGFLLQYVRSGQRAMLDWAQAYAAYYKTHYAYRTDGFEFSDVRKNSGLKVDWYNPKSYMWVDSRAEICHFWGVGIFDYYCLTGDVDALEAGRDLVEHARVLAARAFPKTGSPINLFGARRFARPWAAGIRLASLTRDPKDRSWCDQMFEKAMKASDWSKACGFYVGGPLGLEKWTEPMTPGKISPRLAAHLKENGLELHLGDGEGFVTHGQERWPIMCDKGSWEQHEQAYAFDSYYRLTGDAQARERFLEMATFARDYQWCKHCQFISYKTLVGVTGKDQPFNIWDWEDEHKNCPGPGGTHEPSYTISAVDIFAQAYCLTGDRAWLDLAKTCYNRGTKRGYRDTKQFAADDVVARRVGFEGRSTVDTSILTTWMFYEAARAK